MRAICIRSGSYIDMICWLVNPEVGSNFPRVQRAQMSNLLLNFLSLILFDMHWLDKHGLVLWNFLPRFTHVALEKTGMAAKKDQGLHLMLLQKRLYILKLFKLYLARTSVLGVYLWCVSLLFVAILRLLTLGSWLFAWKTHQHVVRLRSFFGAAICVSHYS